MIFLNLERDLYKHTAKAPLPSYLPLVTSLAGIHFDLSLLIGHYNLLINRPARVGAVGLAFIIVVEAK